MEHSNGSESVLSRRNVLAGAAALMGGGSEYECLGAAEAAEYPVCPFS